MAILYFPAIKNRETGEYWTFDEFTGAAAEGDTIYIGVNAQKYFYEEMHVQSDNLTLFYDGVARDELIYLGAGVHTLTVTGQHEWRINGNGLNNTINGSASNNIIYDGVFGAGSFNLSDSDILNGGGGDDYIFSYGGFDTLTGGDGNDYFEFYLDSDKSEAIGAIINGGDGYDVLYTQTDDFSKYKISNVEVLEGVEIIAKINQLRNVDKVRHVDDGKQYATVRIEGQGGKITFKDKTENDDSVFVEATNAKTSVVIITTENGDSIQGTRFNDKLQSGKSGDYIDGKRGNDKIYGEEGSDILIGGAGRDTFFFDTRLNGTGSDEIRDFSTKRDNIALEKDVFRSLIEDNYLRSNVLYRESFAIIDSKYDQERDDRILYDTRSGYIYYDADGLFRHDPIKFAEVDSGLPLTFRDFVLI